MMIEVDGLSRRFGPVRVQHLRIVALLHKIDITNQHNAYNSSIGPEKNVPRHDTTAVYLNTEVLILTERVILTTAISPI